MRRIIKEIYVNKITALLLLILLLIIILIIKHINSAKPMDIVSGEIDFTQEPVQIELEEVETIIVEKKDVIYKIYPQAEYKISARVLSKKRYRTDYASKIIPYDLALGWGKLGEEKYVDYYSFRSFNRRCMLIIPSDCPLGVAYTSSHFSNNHIIPANKNIEKAINSLKPGHLVTIEGYLVNVITEAWEFRTSLTRTDMGRGACEVIYVNTLRIENKVYE